MLRSQHVAQQVLATLEVHYEPLVLGGADADPCHLVEVHGGLLALIVLARVQLEQGGVRDEKRPLLDFQPLVDLHAEKMK